MRSTLIKHFYCFMYIQYIQCTFSSFILLIFCFSNSIAIIVTESVWLAWFPNALLYNGFCRSWSLSAPGRLGQCLRQEVSTVCCPSLETMVTWCTRTLCILPCILYPASVARWNLLTRVWLHVWSPSLLCSDMKYVLTNVFNCFIVFMEIVHYVAHF